jgi:quercetin dioxygenase-like cupin family protein
MNDASSQSAKLIPGDQGKRQNVLGDNQRVLLTGDDTGGSYALIEDCNPPGMRIPLHLHRNEDEMFYVVEGQVEFQIDNEMMRASAGTTVHVPRDIPHAFTIIGDVPAKMLIMLIPAGLEKYFEELSQLPSDGAPDMAKVVAISARYGIEFVSVPGGPAV